jgi:hypothetical protein
MRVERIWTFVLGPHPEGTVLLSPASFSRRGFCPGEGSGVPPRAAPRGWADTWRANTTIRFSAL